VLLRDPGVEPPLSGSHQGGSSVTPSDAPLEASTKPAGGVVAYLSERHQ